MKQQLLDLQAQIMDLQAQQVQQPSNPIPGGLFALNPATANQDDIDFNSTMGMKLFKTITSPLDTKFEETGITVAFY